MSFVVYWCDFLILAAYWALATGRKGGERWFHAANAAGGIPMVMFEIATHAWPLLPVTGTFCLLGWWGCLT